MSGPVGILGPLVFVGGLGSTFTFHGVSKKRQNAFVKHQIINGLDLIEDVGFKPLEVDLDCRFYEPWTANPSVSLALLETLEDAKIPVPLFIGPTPMGRGPLTLWVVEEITSKMTKFSGGTLVVLDVNIKLLEYSNPLALSGALQGISQVASAAVNVGAGLVASIQGTNALANGAIGGVQGARGPRGIAGATGPPGPEGTSLEIKGTVATAADLPPV